MKAERLKKYQHDADCGFMSYVGPLRMGRLLEERWQLLEALKARHCGCCDGSGIAFTHPDETEVGCAPGSSGVRCPECADSLDAIAYAEAEEDVL